MILRTRLQVVAYFGMWVASAFIAGPEGTAMAGPRAPAANFRAAAGAREIQFPAGVPIAGYGIGKRRREAFLKSFGRPYENGGTDLSHVFFPAEGYLDPIRTKAMIFENGGQKLLFLSLDLLMMPSDLYKRISNEMVELGFDADQVFIAATHTHSGPGAFSGHLIWELGSLDYVEPVIADQIVEETKRLVSETLQNLEPAVLYKSYFETTGLQANRSNPQGLVDRGGRLLYIRSKSGTWLGSLINYGVHGTSLGPDNMYLSADMPGTIEREMEAALQSRNANARRKPVALFFSAAAGDIKPAGDGYSFAQQAGKAFASQAISNLNRARPVTPAWTVTSEDVEINSPRFRGEGCAQTSDEFTKYLASLVDIPLDLLVNSTTRISRIDLGDLHLFTFPGEMTTRLYYKLLSQVSGNPQNSWVLGLTNDYLLYFVHEDDYEHVRGLENCLSVFGPEGSQMLLDAHTAMMAKGVQ